MKEVSRFLSFKQLVTIPNHPVCNGLVERFNQTIKKMLMRMCAERPNDWDQYINPFLFACMEAPHDSLSFIPLNYSTVGQLGDQCRSLSNCGVKKLRIKRYVVHISTL